MHEDEQVSQLNEFARARGILPPPAELKEAVSGDGVAPAQPEGVMVRLPIDGQRLSLFAREVGELLAGRAGIYRWREQLVTVDEETGGRVEMSPQRFRSFAERWITPVKVSFAKGKAQEHAQTMTTEQAQGCLAADEFRTLMPRLQRVNTVRLPVRREDGQVELLPRGYDGRTGVYTLLTAPDYDEAMTVEEAVAFLLEFHGEFPFAEKGEDGRCRSLAVHMCNFLSQFGYLLLAPEDPRAHFFYAANSSRSGKTLLIKIVLQTIWGVAKIDSLPREAKALKDLLDTAVLCGAPALVFDEISGRLSNETLNAFMTADTWGGRKFHTQEEFQAPASTVLMLAGNNVEISDDLAGRSLRCELFREEADAQARRINDPITPERLRRLPVRRKLLSALWAIVKAWGAQQGDLPVGRRLVGFEDWSRIFGGMVVMAGFGDPLEPVAVDSFGDTDKQDIQLLVGSLAAEVGAGNSHEYDFPAIVARCRELAVFQAILDAETKEVRHKEEGEVIVEQTLTQGGAARMGKLLAKYNGQQFSTGTGRVRFGRKGRNRHRKFMVEVAAK